MDTSLEDFEADVPTLTVNEQLGVLMCRVKEAQDTCGWADPTTRDGQMQLASGAVEYGRVLTEILMILRSTIGAE